MRPTSRLGTAESAPGNFSPGFTASGDVDNSIDQTLIFVQLAHTPLTFTRDITQSLILVNTATKNTRYLRNINDLAVLINVTIPNRRAFRNIVQTLVLDDSDPSFIRVKERNIADTLVLSPTLESVKWAQPVINESLIINQTLSKQNIFIRAITESIPLKGGIVKTLRNTDYYINEVELIKVPRKCTVVFECGDRLIVLPCPEFNDTEKLLHSMVIKRSMTNKIYSYVRKNDLEQLSYSFILGRGIAFDFEDFIEHSIEKVITLRNWKGELWKGHITTNPVEFIPKSRYENEGERVEVAIEFQGIRLL